MPCNRDWNAVRTAPVMRGFIKDASRNQILAVATRLESI
jgi:hypothetical protein